MSRIIVDIRKFHVKHLAFFVLSLYPLLIQLRKIFTVDIYYFTLTPMSTILIFYFLLFALRSPLKIDLANIFLITFSILLGETYWNSPESSIYYYTQYYIFEILAYISLILRMPARTLVVAISYQTCISLIFIGFEILISGGINFSAISHRQLGIGKGSITGFFDEPALLSYAYMLNLFIIVCGIEKEIIKKNIGIALILATFFVVILTMTRANIIYFPVAFFLFLIFYARGMFNKKTKNSWIYKKKKTFFTITTAGALFLYGTSGYINNRFGDRSELSVSSITLSESVGINLPTMTANLIYRIDQTQAAIKTIIEHPFGVGPLKSIDNQYKNLIFKYLASYNSGNLITDFTVNFGLPLSAFYFLVIFSLMRFSVTGDKATTLILRLGNIYIAYNIIIATNVIVAITSTAVRFIEKSPDLYIGLPIYIGPRNIDGFAMVTFLIFSYKAKYLKNQEV